MDDAHSPKPDDGIVRDAEYATVSHGKEHRTAAIWVAGFIVLLAGWDAGPEAAAKMLRLCVLPVLLIWFPDHLEGDESGRRTSAEVIRITGWSILIVIPAVLLIGRHWLM